MKGRRIFSFLCYWATVYLLRIVRFFLFRINVIGLSNLPNSGSLILVANHISFLDPPLLAMAMKRRLLFLAKRNVIPRFFVNADWAYPIGSIKTLRKTIRWLKNGGVVVIFPEGQIKQGDLIHGLQDGFYYLAKKGEAKILPVGIWGTQNVLPLGSWLIRPGLVTVRLGKPFSIGQMNSSQAISKTVLELGKLISKS